MSQDEYNNQQMQQWDEEFELGLLGEYLGLLALAGEGVAATSLLSFYYSTPCWMQH